MPDVPIVNRAMVTAPKDYVLPQGQEVLLKAVRAEFDGTGAGGSYLPALQLISDAGDVMWTAVSSSQTIAAGGTQSVSWFPGVSSAGGNTPPIPGTILSVYAGLSPATDFTTNSTSYVQSNFPTNTSFTKVSSTSVLGIYGQFDFTPGGTQPDVLFLGIFIDGANAEATGCQTALANSFVTAVISTVKGFTGTTYPPLAAGSHTVDVRVACDQGANFTLRTHSACDLCLVEFVA